MKNQYPNRRQMMIESAAGAVALASAGQVLGGPGTDPQVGKPGGMAIGFHTGAFNSAYFSFDKCLAWAQRNGVPYIECGVIDGTVWSHGLGYYPHIALHEDPVLMRKKMEGYGVRFSQIDAAYPLSGRDGPVHGESYVLRSIAWAA